MVGSEWSKLEEAPAKALGYDGIIAIHDLHRPKGSR
jgi:hypothetical protein